MTGPRAKKRIGIIAGGGTMPGEVAESVVRRGGEVHLVLVDGVADPALKAYPHTIVYWSQPGRAASAFKQAGVRDIVMLGTFDRPQLASARPDLTFIRELPAIIRLLRAGGDDALLRCLIALFERLGLRVIGVGDAAPDLLATDGDLTSRTPSREEEGDILIGFRLIDALGSYDIGQAAVIAAGRVVAVEAAEGTDRMLARIAEARRRAPADITVAGRGGVLVKRPKPQQDLRIDLPTIGPGTVKSAKAAGLDGIAVMSGHVLTAECPRLIAEAEAAGLFVAGRPSASGLGPAPGRVTPPRQVGHIAPPEKSAADIARGIAILHDLAAFAAGSAVVVRRRRVLAVGTDEVAEAAITRANQFLKKRRRDAVAVVASGSGLTDSLLEAAPAAKYAGFVVVGEGGAGTDIAEAFADKANARGQFVAYARSEAEGAAS